MDLRIPQAEQPASASFLWFCRVPSPWDGAASSRGAAPWQWSLSPRPQAESELDAEAGGKRMAWRGLGVNQSRSGKS